jgi:hypothetical protein
MKNLNYEERLRKLKLPTLGYRRVRGDMIEMYKIIKGKYDKDVITLVKTEFYLSCRDICSAMQ